VWWYKKPKKINHKKSQFVAERKNGGAKITHCLKFLFGICVVQEGDFDCLFDLFAYLIIEFFVCTQV
jgi:hypothetical protein